MSLSGEVVEEAAEIGVAGGERAQRLEAVDHDDARAVLLDQRVDAFRHGGEPVLMDGVAEIVVEHRASDLLGVEEGQFLPEAQQLVERFRHRRQIESGAFERGVGEQTLFGQDRLTGPRRADDEGDRVRHEAAAEDVIEPRVARGEALHQATGIFEGRVKALEPSRSRTVETNCKGTTGLARNALAPAAIA